MKESDRELIVLDWLNKRGIFAWKCKTQGTYDPIKGVFRSLGKFSLKGISDILGCMPNGQFLAIEMKTPIGRLSKEQKAFLNKINRQGGKAFVARNVEDVKDGLAKQHGKLS